MTLHISLGGVFLVHSGKIVDVWNHVGGWSSAPLWLGGCSLRLSKRWIPAKPLQKALYDCGLLLSLCSSLGQSCRNNEQTELAHAEDKVHIYCP